MVPVGRGFLRRLYVLTIGRTKCATIKLGIGAKADLLTWLTFMHKYNAREVYKTRTKYTSVKDHVYSDESDLGYGASLGSGCFYGEFTEKWCK